jgi:heme/copper-type cytochrome/quinol oxidase subunit 4
MVFLGEADPRMEEFRDGCPFVVGFIFSIIDTLVDFVVVDNVRVPYDLQAHLFA